MNLNFDPNELTIADIEDFETHTGRSIFDAFDGQGNIMRDTKVLAGVVLILKRREDPEFTIEQARRVKFGELGLFANPTPPAEKSAPKPRRSRRAAS